MKIEEVLSFDDVLLSPQHSSIFSRKDVDISTTISKHLSLKIPIISSCMDTVTGPKMAIAMWNAGGLGILHRYNTIAEQCQMFYDVYSKSANCAIAIGINGDFKDRIKALIFMGAKIFCFDVAHGDCDMMIDALKWFRATYGNDFTLIAGNVATADAAGRLMDAGADAIRVGVGGGCFAAGTKVLMANGTYKNIEAINLHDRVINMNGDAVEVIGVKMSGIKKTISIKNNFWHKYTTVTQDHKHWVGDLNYIKDIQKIGKANELNKSNNYLWKPIGDTTKQDFLLLPKKINFETCDTFEIDLNNFAFARRKMEGSVKLPTINPNYDLGYLFGSFLGDGTAKIAVSTRNKNHKNTSGNMYWSFSIHEYEIAEKVKSAFKNIFDYECLIQSNDKKNMLKVIVRSNPIIRFFEKFGKREKKKLPEYLWCKNKEYCLGIVDGLVDSDGHLDGKRDGITNTSESIIELYMFCHYIARGYFPSATDCTRSTAKNAAYSLRSVARPEYNWTHNYQISAINDKTEINAEEIKTYDIEVDCPTHSFIANNAIVHNSLCTTRLVSGSGVPTFQSILDCYRYLGNSVCLISDGGIKNSGDVVKSIAAGANAVMLGQLLAGTDEAPGEIINKSNGKFKVYRGMASRSAQVDWRPEKENEIVPEGEETLLPYKGTVNEILYQLIGGLRSGMTYSNARTLNELKEKAEFKRITSAGWAESKPHAKQGF